MKILKSTVTLLVLCLSILTGTPARAQLADPLSLAALGVLLPFFSDPAAGFASVFEITSPVVPRNFTNPIHAVFFNATCTRDGSTADVLTGKQAKAFVSSASPLSLTFNGLAAFATSPGGNDLTQASFPFHSRTHWVDVKTGRLRQLEPITVATFLSLDPSVLLLVTTPPPGTITLGLPFVWNPLRSAATFVTPQESASVRGSIYLICPRDSIQSPSGGGVFSSPQFPRLVNRDGSFGFQGSQLITGASVARLRARVYDDNEALVRDSEIPCDCLTARALLDVDGVYGTAPTNLGGGTLPVWYTELESTAQTSNPIGGSPATLNSFTGYWGLEVAGSAATLFHRMSNASLDNLSAGTANAFGNR